MKMDSLTLTDEQLVEEFNNGSFLCFDEVLTRYESKLFYFLKMFIGGEREAEEALQELAVIAFTRLSESLTATEKKEGSVKRWLYGQAISIAQYKTSEKKRDLVVEKLRLREDLDEEGLTLEQAIGIALAELPVEYRLSFLLWDVAGFDLTEVSLLTGVIPFEARMRIHRARLGIRKLSLKRRQIDVTKLARVTPEAPGKAVTIN
jgi:DNA-directed RNA polymerase specialized sigma24 family protein